MFHIPVNTSWVISEIILEDTLSSSAKHLIISSADSNNINTNKNNTKT